MPEIHINFAAVAVAVVANFIFGFLWYTPLFGKAWAAEMGFDMSEKPSSAVMIKGLVIMVVGNFLMAWVFAHDLAVWNPATWGQGPSEMSAMQFAGSAAFFTWLGFYVPSDLSVVAWEKKSWKLFFINTVYHLLTLVIAGMILIYMSW